MKNVTTALLLGLLAALTANAQTNNFIVNHPAVKAAVGQYLTERIAKAAASVKSADARFAATSPVFGGGFSLSAPPVALWLNRLQYDERDALQASLLVLSNMPLPSGPVGLSVLWVHLDSDYSRGTYTGQHVLLPGETIPLQTYIFDGSEPSGLYALVVMVTDTTSGQLLAMPGTHFIFRGFRRTDTQGYLRVDSAEAQGQFVVLRGNFPSEVTPGQFALIGGQKFPIIKSVATFAIVDLGNAYALPAGVYDIMMVVHFAGNTAYDSITAPCILRLFLPLSYSSGGKGG